MPEQHPTTLAERAAAIQSRFERLRGQGAFTVAAEAPAALADAMNLIGDMAARLDYMDYLNEQVIAGLRELGAEVAEPAQEVTP